MNKNTAGHIQLISWGVVGLVVIGLVTDQLAWSLALGFGAYLVWSVRQAIRLHRWLHEEDKDIPESYGLWGDLFEGLYRIQRKNEKSEAHLRALIKRVRQSTNALRDSVIMTNALGEMEWWNRASERLFGFREDQDQGQLITNLVRNPEFKRYFMRKDYDDALDIVSPIDNNIRLRVHITLFGKEDRLVVAQDVTRVHQLEQMRRDFVSNVSHEMRTPLTVLHGYLETIQGAEDMPKKWRRPLKSMYDQTQRLEVLVSDLLLLEKYESGDRRMNEKTVDVNKLLEMVCHDADLFSGDGNHKITLASDAKDMLLGDENQLRSAFSNLVFNAVKYTPENGSIFVEAWQDESGLFVSVRDTGCGIDPIHIPRLTERFYRADPSRNNQTGGSGLGLAIVKHVLINHHATLDIKSELDHGSEFTCHFPCHALKQASPSKQAVGV